MFKLPMLSYGWVRRDDPRADAESMSRETIEQKVRFYTEVAALMGNQSAQKRLDELRADDVRRASQDLTKGPHRP